MNRSTLPPKKPATRAVDRADEQHQHAGQQANRQGNTGAHHNADGIVAPQGVRAQNVGKHLFARGHGGLLRLGILHGAQVLAAADLSGVIVRVKRRHDKRQDQHDDQHRKAHHGDGVFPQTAQTVLPEADAFAHDGQAFLFGIAGGRKVVDVELHAQDLFFVFHSFALLPLISA